MSIFMTLLIALKALSRNKMRTMLTMLGMIIGVGAVITMVALGKGAQSTIEAQVKAAGTNLITINAGNFTQGGVRQGGGMSTTLTVEDAQALRSVAGVQYLAAGVNSRAQLIAGNQNWSSQIQGTDVELPLIRNWPTKYGSFFTAQDVSSAAKVAVLGQTVVGQPLRPRCRSDRPNHPRQEPAVQGDRRDVAQGQHGLRRGSGRRRVRAVHDGPEEAPGHSAHQQHHGLGGLAGNGAGVGGASPTRCASRHKLMGSDPDDFMVRTQEEMASVRTETTRTMTTLLAAIAGVSLLVGGIGIMNIMLVSVTERTREIGLRMAIGARGTRRPDAVPRRGVVLSLFGGLLGIGMGYALSAAAEKFLQWPTSIPANAIGMAFGFAAATGVFFGFYPAKKAAGLDPIEALRFE